MKVRLSLFGLFILIAFAGNAQSTRFMDGYVINNEGDSLGGLVAIDKDWTWVAYKPQKGAERTVFRSGDMKAFGVGGVDYICETVEVLRNRFPEHVHAWLKVVVNGPVQLVEYNSQTLFGDDAREMFIRAGDSTLLYRVPRKEKQFAKRMSEYFGIHEEMSAQILRGELVYADLPRIVILFNSWYMDQL